MKIFDISQEVFSCEVYPGDVSPKRELVAKIDEKSVCNLTAFSMCAHNGTHIDAPYHFYNDGKKIDEIELKKLIGNCYVAEVSGDITENMASEIIKKAKSADEDSAKRILIKGNCCVTLEAAKLFSKAQIYLIGNESQTVGPYDAPGQVHYELLKNEIVLLEGIRLGEVEEGVYFLNAAPLNLGGSDGAPCRAVLIKE